jgi:5-methylcytosine-specific restriction endonuclease McrA
VPRLKACLEYHECGAFTDGSRCPAHEQRRRQAANAKRTATSPYRSPEHRREAAAAIRRDGACVLCSSTVRLQAHHVIRRASGGADHRSNYVALCARCHVDVETAERRNDLGHPGLLRVRAIGAALRAQHRPR